VTSSVFVFEGAIRVTLMYMIKSWLRTRKKRKEWNKLIFT